MDYQVTFPHFNQPYTHWLVPVENWKRHGQNMANVIQVIEETYPDTHTRQRIIDLIRADGWQMTIFDGLRRVHVAMEDVA